MNDVIIKGYKVGDTFWYKFYDGDWDESLGRYKWRGKYKKDIATYICEDRFETDTLYINLEDIVPYNEAIELNLIDEPIPSDNILHKILKMCLCYDTIKKTDCSCFDYIKKNW